MKEIDNYIDNLFSIYEDRSEVNSLKEGLRDSLRLKYEAYIQEGLDSDQAFGRAIREFGSIDEIKEDLESFILTKNTSNKTEKRDYLDTAIWMTGISLFIYTGMKFGSWGYNWIIILLTIAVTNLVDYFQN